MATISYNSTNAKYGVAGTPIQIRLRRDAGGLGSGVYVVKAKAEGLQYHKRLVLQR